MNITLTNARFTLNGQTVALEHLTLEAESADLTITSTHGRYGGMPLDTPRITHVTAGDDSVLVEDITPGNEEKGVVFTPLGTKSNDDEPGLWAEIYGGEIREEQAGTYTTGELFFGHGEEKVSIQYDPEGATVGETGY